MAEPLPDDGWPTHYVTHSGRQFARIAYGDEPGDGGADRHPCRDCCVAKGEFHVSGMCEVERCPKCGGQFVSCYCDFVGEAEDDVSELNAESE